MSVGRKSVYETKVKARFDEIKKWLLNGATEKEIMKNLGISHQTFNRYKKQFSELSELLKEGRQRPVEEIKGALYRKAIGYEYQEETITTTEIEFDENLKEALLAVGFDVEKMTSPKQIKKVVSKKPMPPDTTAAIYLLKHWDKESGWTSDPQTLELKKKEFELKKEQIEKESW